MADQATDAVAQLFTLPLDEFTAARNALASRLKKSGRVDQAEVVKRLSKPAVSAWAVNQLYWRHRKPFDGLLASGSRLRQAQTAQLAGKKSELRGAVEAHRKALADLASRAAAVLRDGGYAVHPETIRRVTTTLEALSAYGEQQDAPRPGQLMADVDPPGFEALAALVPRVGGRAETAGASRVLPFQQHRRGARASKPKASSADARRDEAQALRSRTAAAKARVRDAEKALRAARANVGRAEAALKKAAAVSREAEKKRTVLERGLEKAAATADRARLDARRIAARAEEAAQTLAEAETALETARRALDELS